MEEHRYDRIGSEYAINRRTEPRFAQLLWAALADAERILNVGAGTGSYEPPDARVVAVEPSRRMVLQRPRGIAPAIRGVAEHLPVPTQSFDAVMVVLSVHHWADRAAGFRELRRVARRQVVFTYDPAVHSDFWLLRDYLPGVGAADARRAPSIAEVADGIGASDVVPVPVPFDCIDGVLPAHWRRPAAYLDPVVRQNASGLALADPRELAGGIDRLRQDLADGSWHHRYRELLDESEYDAGFRILTADHRER